ncbi:Probable transmembrane protein of unknown function [Tenacibaculum jejuense]|uniref:HTH luxR-type domain-containing protein n=1 Tax=Tenacibaculum jejuense TaxID=584609 RepID=A0A238UC22_9FLAO|nr:Probable transmembrane protein of unknown function [Tenacibaculum jejuense]
MKSFLKRLQTSIEKRRKIILILILSINQQLLTQNTSLTQFNFKVNPYSYERNESFLNRVLGLHKTLFYTIEDKTTHTTYKSKIVVLGFFLFFLTSSYLIINRYRGIFLEKQKKLDTQKKILLKKEKKLKQKIDLKNKLLSSYAFNFQQKNEIINKVFSLARGFEKTSSISEEKKLIQELIHIGKENLQVDKEWEHFRLFFEETLAGFHSKLKSKHPELNSNDLKICSLIRLNLNIKEAANILNISPGSLKTARYRLRKKLNLKPGQKIIDYIIKIDQEDFC